jgi:hypothetical protein
MIDRQSTLLVAFALALTPALARADEKPDAAGVEFFEKKIRPILVDHCFRCHSSAKKPEGSRARRDKGGLRLDSREAALKGGDNGPAIVPGQPEKSKLIEAVGYKNVDLQMPPKSKLSDAAIADLTTWIKMGAPWPATGSSAEVKVEGFDLARRKGEHWAWKPIKASESPKVRDQAWPTGAVDFFLLAKLEAKGLKPAPDADRRTLLRRVYFDLIGLPPTPEQVEAFVNDKKPDALARVVDVLLDSPQFGERWARHWLDLVRYGESRGHEFDYTAPNAYQYRDYVIRALNADLAYNQLVTEHLAGDLLDKPRLNPKEGFNESILGTGFWFLGEEIHSPVDIRQDQADRFDNRIDVLTKTFLGLTVSCARCHDHKFDAISTKDYYALYGFLESSSYRLARFDSLEQNRKVAAELAKLRERLRTAVAKSVAEAVRGEAAHSAEYLLAAREVILAVPDAEKQRTPAAYLRKLDEIARARKLDSAALSAWVTAVQSAGKDENDPLHPWSRLSRADAKDPMQAGTVLRNLAESYAKRTRETAAAEVVVDYRQPTVGAWIPDDFSFGPAPARAGEVKTSGEPGQPAVRLTERGAAEIDPFWNGLKLAPRVELDPGATGRVARAGRTIRTPVFTVNSGKVHYLVRGSGTIYAAVDQHILINGPLHGSLVKAVKGTDRYQWVTHDLTPYRGRGLHVEFTAGPGSDFAVAMVVQGERSPALDRPGSGVVALLGGDDARSLETLAAGYQRFILAGADRLATNRLTVSDDAGDQAKLLNVVLRQPNVKVNGSVAELLTEESRLATQVKAESRLAMAMLDGTPVDERVFIRGSPKALGPTVPRRFLEALTGTDALATRGSGRLELARQMTDPRVNPFITRVMVNRVWHHLFGRGIVPSVDNFGVLGEAPTHPELLDHLADRFAKEGWSTKKLIRTLMLSRAYRQASSLDEASRRAAEAVDPKNELLHRMRVRRLEGEAIRDAILATSGRLDLTMYGPSVPVYLNEFQDGRGKPGSGPMDGNGRRSIYLGVRRNFLSAMLLAFDQPIPFSTVGRRTVSNVPAQALILMNDPFVHQQASLWAKRAQSQPGGAKERITWMYASAFARAPTEVETKKCLAFLESQGKLHGDPAAPAAWSDLAHVLYNSKEFIFVH